MDDCRMDVSGGSVVERFAVDRQCGIHRGLDPDHDYFHLLPEDHSPRHHHSEHEIKAHRIRKPNVPPIAEERGSFVFLLFKNVSFTGKREIYLNKKQI